MYAEQFTLKNIFTEHNEIGARITFMSQILTCLVNLFECEIISCLYATL